MAATARRPRSGGRTDTNDRPTTPASGWAAKPAPLLLPWSASSPLPSSPIAADNRSAACSTSARRDVQVSETACSTCVNDGIPCRSVGGK